MSAQESRSLERTRASPDAIFSHYDMGEDFFRLVLDPDLNYSCAMFEGDEDLATAQNRKLDHHIGAANAAGTARVLDIGCGWGAMLRRLVNHAGVEHAVGLTLSASQARSIRQHGDPKITVLEQDWRDHRPEKRYNAIISIGAFEHFVQKGLDPVRKLDAYRGFFAYCDRILATGGKLSLQTIAYSEHHKVHPLLEKTFPESDLPLVWEPIAAAEGRFQLMSLRNDADHYYRTLQFWEQNLMENYDKAVALVGQSATDEFHRYLQLTAAGFRVGMASLLRISFVKKY